MTAQELWKAVKWSNQNPDGSITISKDRVQGIEKTIKESRNELYEALKSVLSSVVCNGDFTVNYAIDGKIRKQINDAISHYERGILDGNSNAK